MKHWLIVYRRSNGTLLLCQEFDDSGAALDERFRLERKHRDDPDLEIATLGSDSLETVMHTHGRYFFTVPQLAQRMLEALDA